MGDMVDSVNPANIGPEHNGELAARITVLADPAGEVFDLESGNAGADRCARAIAARFRAGHFSTFYVNESTEAAAVESVAAAGVPLLGVEVWPAPGCYLWPSDPSGNIAAGRWRPPVAPVAVQDRFLGPVDLSTTFGSWPFGVAGYIDGPVSQWPAAAWARFATFTQPIPPAPGTEDDDMITCMFDPESHQQHVFRERQSDGLVDHWYYAVAHDGQAAVPWQHEVLPAPAG